MGSAWIVVLLLVLSVALSLPLRGSRRSDGLLTISEAFEHGGSFSWREHINDLLSMKCLEDLLTDLSVFLFRTYENRSYWYR